MWAHRENFTATREYEHQMMKALAWWSACMERQERLPSLNVFLNPIKQLEGEAKATAEADHQALIADFAFPK